MMLEPKVLNFRGSGDIELVGDSRGDDADPVVLFLHGGGQTRHSWGGAAVRIAERGWRAVTLDARGHGESAWSPTGDYRLVSFAEDLHNVIGDLGTAPVLVGASLGGLTSMLLVGELAPGAARAVVLVDIVPDMEPTGAQRIHAFMAERAHLGFDSLEQVAEAIAEYNPHRPPPTDLAGLGKNLRERDGRYFWHWDPAFMDSRRPTGILLR